MDMLLLALLLSMVVRELLYYNIRKVYETFLETD